MNIQDVTRRSRSEATTNPGLDSSVFIGTESNEETQLDTLDLMSLMGGGGYLQ